MVWEVFSHVGGSFTSAKIAPGAASISERQCGKKKTASWYLLSQDLSYPGWNIWTDVNDFDLTKKRYFLLQGASAWLLLSGLWESVQDHSPVPPVRCRHLPKTPGACHRPVPVVALCPWLCLASSDLSYKKNCWKCELPYLWTAYGSTCTSRTSGKRYKVLSLVGANPASFSL